MNERNFLTFFTFIGTILLAPPAPPADPGSGQRLRHVSAALAPERVVYEVFASEVAYRERQVKSVSAPSERERLPRERLRRVMGLGEADYAVWAAISQQLMDALAENAKQGDTILNRSQLTTG